MGLTQQLVGVKAGREAISTVSSTDKVIALAGNPNVGKSTVFNALTGLRQHTGNWAGKTVANAQGTYRRYGQNYTLVDLPGTYSLLSNSREEEIARDFICFSGADCVLVVCDATCLERNLNLVLQILEITRRVVVCVNLMDEAKRKGIRINLKKLSEGLGVPVIGTSARSKKGLSELTSAVSEMVDAKAPLEKPAVVYTDAIEEAIGQMEPLIKQSARNMPVSTRWLSLKLLDCDDGLTTGVISHLKLGLSDIKKIQKKRGEILNKLENNGQNPAFLTDILVSSIVKTAEDICSDVVSYDKKDYQQRDRKIDRFLTGKITGVPIMLLLLALVFWLTLSGANIPSKLLSDAFFWLEERLFDFAVMQNVPPLVYEPLIFGVFRVLGWVVSVMLPPMAIFFPLFTLLEDSGYLPRIAFNMDHSFKKCNACGKQALTMCMGFGCNAVGVVGCRIIDSPRERLMAIITNNFVPCNGRFAPPHKEQLFL